MKNKNENQRMSTQLLAHGICMIVSCVCSISAFGQTKVNTARPDTASTGDAVFNQMLDFSRPGKYHQMLAELTGQWKFEGDRLEWSDSVTSKPVMKLAGSLTRRPYANGRFFIAEMTTAEKIGLPIQDGKMITDYARALQLEGYDNVHKKFQISYINSHIGSDINFWEGDYNAVTKTITFDSYLENVPGMKMKIRFTFVLVDKNHFQWNYYVEQNGKYLKDSEMNFTRVK